MCIRYIYNIPVLGNGTFFPALCEDQDSCTMLEKFYFKYGDEYDLVEAAKKGNKKAKEILSFLWKNKCYHYWNYKNKCANPSFLYDFINFQKKRFEDQSRRLENYVQNEKEKNIDDLNYFKEMRELVGASLIVDGKYFLYDQYIDKLCDYINCGVEEKYKEDNKNNIKKIFELISDIGNQDGICIYTTEFEKLLYTNIVLPMEGLVSGIYLFEVYHRDPALKKLIFFPSGKVGGEDERAEPVKNMLSTPSSMRSKLEKYDVVSLTLDGNKKISKGKEVSGTVDLIQDLRDYTNSLLDYDELSDILEVIRSMPIELSLYESPIYDITFEKCVFFRSELLRHLGCDKAAMMGIFKRSRDVILFNIDEVDSAVRSCLKVLLDSPIHCNNIIRIMNSVKGGIEAQLPQIEYGGFKFLKNNGEDLQDICVKMIRWIDSQYITKILNVSREQSDHVRQIEFPKPTDKQIEMFEEALIDYRWLFEFDYSWLNEFLGIDSDERIKLDDKVNRFMKQINNEALVGSGCEPNNIQKILIYQICALEDSLCFSADHKYYLSGHKKERTLKQILHPRAKPDAKISIWLNTLMRKQLYVNLGHEDVFNIAEDCHNLIADDYKKMIDTGIFLTDIYDTYNEELKKISKGIYEFLGQVMKGEIYPSWYD